MVESGWSGSACGPAFNICIPSPWLDEAMYVTLSFSAVGPIVNNAKGHAFTTGTKATMDWQAANSKRISSDSTPSFVFAHLVAPHPPFMLDATCSTVVERDRAGIQFYQSGIDRSTRETLFVDQMTCINSFRIELADLIEPDDVVIFVGDHGTDRRNQLETPAGEWSHQGVVERMNVLAALRTGNGCNIEDNVVIPNLMRRVLSCFASSQLDEVASRIFIGTTTELSSKDVEDLLGSGLTGWNESLRAPKGAKGPLHSGLIMLK